MRKLFLTVLVIVSACSTSEKPDDLIGKEKMVKVMTEVHLLEAKISELPIRPTDSIQPVYDHYEKMLFNDLGISKEQYEKSFNYYVDNPADFEKIYNVVVDSLMQREKLGK